MSKKRLYLISVAALPALALALACGKSDDEGDNSGSGSTTGTGVTIGGGGTNPSGTAANSGLPGTVTTLTTEQTEAILDSACNAWAAEGEAVGGKIEFVVDISGSMSTILDGDSMSKWEITREALREAIVGVNTAGLGADTAVGVLFYPGLTLETVPTEPSESENCLDLTNSLAMEMLGGADSEQRQALSDGLDAVATGRSTPTNDAYTYALNNVVLSAEAQAFTGNPYMVLITDGMPTLDFGCFNSTGDLDYEAVPTDPIIEKIADAYTNHGVKTFVIGSPGSDEGRGDDQYDWLSAAARAGGTASSSDCTDTGSPSYCHMDMTQTTDFSADLKAGLDMVASQITGCKYAVPTESADGTQTVDTTLISPIITFSGGTTELIGVNGTGSCSGEGYRLNSATELEFCPTTCDRMMADAGATVQLVFGCSVGDLGTILQ